MRAVVAADRDRVEARLARATTSAISSALPRFAETLAIGTEPIGTEPIGMSCSVSGGSGVSSFAKSLPWSSIGTDPIGTERDRARLQRRRRRLLDDEVEVRARPRCG